MPYTTEEKQEIAQTISKQIGNHAFFMLGARYKGYDEDENGNVYFSFRIRGSNKVNYIKITYNSGLDLYDMEFGKIHGTDYTVVKAVDGVYFDIMHDIIERVTGLYVSL